MLILNRCKKKKNQLLSLTFLRWKEYLLALQFSQKQLGWAPKKFCADLCRSHNWILKAIIYTVWIQNWNCCCGAILNMHFLIWDVFSYSFLSVHEYLSNYHRLMINSFLCCEGHSHMQWYKCVPSIEDFAVLGSIWCRTHWPEYFLYRAFPAPCTYLWKGNVWKY